LLNINIKYKKRLLNYRLPIPQFYEFHCTLLKKFNLTLHKGKIKMFSVLAIISFIKINILHKIMTTNLEKILKYEKYQD